MVSCDFCGSRYEVADGIPKLVVDKELDTKLDTQTYSKLASFEPHALLNVHKEFSHALAAVGLEPRGAMLEIRTGAGMLTEAMLLHASFETIIASDVSLAFARQTRQRLERFSEIVDFVVCDRNRLPFRTASFELVLGRSVLHRLLHYRSILSGILRVLKPGGAAVFFEPVQAGKAYVAFLFRIILGMEAASGSIGLTDGEKLRMTNSVKGMTRSICISQDLETLSKLDDKYSFEPEDLCREGRELGFSAARYVAVPNVDPTYFPYLSMHLRNAGVRPEVIDKVRWLRAAFGETIGGVAGHRLTAPMGYFVFVKAASGARARPRPGVVEEAE
jgi:ubiquinone/menaquinone biosynthesis C-methylase UbiE